MSDRIPSTADLVPVYLDFSNFWDSLTEEEQREATKRGLAFAAWCAGRRCPRPDVERENWADAAICALIEDRDLLRRLLLRVGYSNDMSADEWNEGRRYLEGIGALPPSDESPL